MNRMLSAFALLMLVGCGEGDIPTTHSTAETSVDSVPSDDDVLSRILFREQSETKLPTYRNGEESGLFSILESLGGGVGAFDFDRDGLVDFIFPGGGSFDSNGRPTGLPSALLRRRPGGTMGDVSVASRIGYYADRYTHGIAVADFDSDGFDDVLVTGFGGLQLFVNLGDGTFTESAPMAGLSDDQWSSSAAWADFNGDDVVDLYVTHYVNWTPENHPECFAADRVSRDVCSPRQFEGLADSLFISSGDGSFDDVSAEYGIDYPGKGLGVVAGDLDGDSRTDIYVTNDTERNTLLINSEQGFLDVSTSCGAGYSDTGREDGSMGVEIGDYNNDGLPDLWVTNYQNESFALYRNYNGRVFQHVSRGAGITAACGPHVGWGTILADFDNDGDEDIFVANGHVIRHPTNTTVTQSPLVLENTDLRFFRDVTSGCGAYCSSKHLNRGVAACDADSDGDIDLVVSTINGPASLLINESAVEDTNWVQFRLIGTRSSRTPIGASVTIEFGSGAVLIQRQTGGGSFASASDGVLHFGLGADSVKSVTITWPSGDTDKHMITAANRALLVVEGRDQLYELPDKQ